MRAASELQCVLFDLFKLDRFLESNVHACVGRM